MTTQYRKTAGTVSNLALPRVPTDWAKGGRQWAMDLLRALERQFDVVLQIQDADTDEPLRAKLSFVGASVTDDLANDRIQISIGGGAGAAPVNAQYVVLALNATLTQERVLTPGTGIAGADAGAGSTYTLSLDTASTRNTDHAGVTLTAGAGLTGGGDITTGRTFAVGAGTGITVNADDVAVTPSYANQFLLMGA